MRPIVLMAPLALLAACSQSEPTPEATETAVSAEAAKLAVDGKPMTGVYEVTSSDGKTVLNITVNADGTTKSVNGDETSNGTWTSTEPGLFCDKYPDAEESCYKEEIGADGVWTAVNVADPADAWTVKRVS